MISAAVAEPRAALATLDLGPGLLQLAPGSQHVQNPLGQLVALAAELGKLRFRPYNRLMMYSLEKYTSLKERYGRVASWAIWDRRNQHDTTIIDKNIAQLSSRYVFAALNVSKDLKDESWINFHAGRHDRKLKYACNDTILRGSYLTDLFKGIAEPKDFKIKGLLTPETIQEHVEAFNREMVDIKLSDDSTLIILGGMAQHYFDIHFRQGYRNKIIFHTHYSDYKISDKQWTEALWDKLNIVQDFDSIVQRYQRDRDDDDEALGRAAGDRHVD